MHETELASGSDPGRSVTPPAAPGSETTTGSPRHFGCFDGLRAIAAVSVLLLLHTAWVSGFTLRSSMGAYTSRLEIGVSVFFLISVFLLYRPFAASTWPAATGPTPGGSGSAGSCVSSRPTGWLSPC